MDKSLHQKKAEDGKRVPANAAEYVIYQFDPVKRDTVRVKSCSYRREHYTCCQVIQKHYDTSDHFQSVAVYFLHAI